MRLAVWQSMQKKIILVALTLTILIATLGRQQEAHACGSGEGDATLALVVGVVYFDAPAAALGAADLLMAATGYEPTRGYAITETIISGTGVALSVALLTQLDGGSVGDNLALSAVLVGVPSLTLWHGVKWIRIHNRRQRAARAPYATSQLSLEAAPRTAAFERSSDLKAAWRLGAMPVSDGKSVGAGVGVLGRF